MANQYDDKYSQRNFYWGKKPSPFCFKVLELLPPSRPLRLIDIGCGEVRHHPGRPFVRPLPASPGAIEGRPSDDPLADLQRAVDDRPRQ